MWTLPFSSCLEDLSMCLSPKSRIKVDTGKVIFYSRVLQFVVTMGVAPKLWLLGRAQRPPSVCDPPKCHRLINLVPLSVCCRLLRTQATRTKAFVATGDRRRSVVDVVRHSREQCDSVDWRRQNAVSWFGGIGAIYRPPPPPVGRQPSP